jgi:hypothetical protein
MITFRSVRRMKNVPDKSARENQNTLFTLNFVCVDNRALYEIMWMNIVKPVPSAVFMFHFVLKFLLYASLLLIFSACAVSDKSLRCSKFVLK